MDENNILIYLSGWLGVTLIFIGFSLNVLTRKFTSESLIFLMLNFFGAWLLVINSFYTGQYHFSLLNSFWGIVAFVGLIKLYRSRTENN